MRGNCGLAHLFLGELEPAERAFRDELVLSDDPGAHLVTEALIGLAVVAARHCHLERAARLAGAARRHLPAGAAADEELLWRQLNDALARAVQSCGDREDWDRFEREGAGLSLKDAMEWALVGGPVFT